MRLLKTHSHNSERRGYEAEKERQAKIGKKGSLSVKGGKDVKENHCRITWKGGCGAKTCQGKAKNRSSATTAARGDDADDAKCEVMVGVTPVSLHKFAYSARSRCHSLTEFR